MTKQQIENNLAIKTKIDNNYKLLETVINAENFVLNNKIHSIYEEINQLQQECSHSFSNGVCIYCYKIEEN